MSLIQLEDAAEKEKLAIFGLCHTMPEDGLGSGTLALFGPAEPGFWAHVNQSPELQDGKPDPLDRWSKRILDRLAAQIRGRALYPFGTPTRPFISWAMRSHRAWPSPVGLLVHDTAGLLVSYRGAILLPDILDLPSTKEPPCTSCRTQPCRTACPVGALDASGYDIPACKDYLAGPAPAGCNIAGCAVRRACPVSQSYPRIPEQSAFHMAAFRGSSRN
ncbi:MAG: ferredoxin [Pseudomonadota bacterium]